MIIPFKNIGLHFGVAFPLSGMGETVKRKHSISSVFDVAVYKGDVYRGFSLLIKFL